MRTTERAIKLVNKIFEICQKVINSNEVKRSIFGCDILLVVTRTTSYPMNRFNDRKSHDALLAHKKKRNLNSLNIFSNFVNSNLIFIYLRKYLFSFCSTKRFRCWTAHISSGERNIVSPIGPSCSEERNSIYLKWIWKPWDFLSAAVYFVFVFGCVTISSGTFLVGLFERIHSCVYLLLLHAYFSVCRFIFIHSEL